MPITAFIGVRISWLIVARNALLASLAASAAARASCVSLEQARVLDRDHGLVGEVSSSAISLSVNGCGGWRERRQWSRRRGPPRPSAPTTSEKLPSLAGHAADRRRARLAMQRVRHSCTTRRSRMTRGDHGLLDAARPERPRTDGRRRRAPRPGGRMRPARRSSSTMPSCSVQANRRWQLSRILSNTGCGVGHRAADHLQHFGGGGLLLERLLASR